VKKDRPLKCNLHSSRFFFFLTIVKRAALTREREEKNSADMTLVSFFSSSFVLFLFPTPVTGELDVKNGKKKKKSYGGKNDNTTQ